MKIFLIHFRYYFTLFFCCSVSFVFKYTKKLGMQFIFRYVLGPFLALSLLNKLLSKYRSVITNLLLFELINIYFYINLYLCKVVGIRINIFI